MNFKINKWKIIITMVVIVIWFLILNSVRYSCVCAECIQPLSEINCEKVFTLELIPQGCHCGCSCPKSTSIGKIFSDLIIILFPGILVYIIWSLFEKKRNK